MKNAEVAHQLNEIADLLEIQQVQFKPRAYRRAARAVENLYEPIEEIAEAGELEAIDGVGESIAKKIQEYVDTGHIAYLDELKEKMPADIEALTAVEGLGPKRVEALYEALGIQNLDDLEAAAKAGKIAEVEGFGEKTQQRILEHIPLARAGQERTLLGKAFPIVADLVETLQETGTFERLEPVGSFRRRMPTIGDVDLLATAQDPGAAMDAFTSLGDVAEVLAKGETKSSLRLTSGLQVDLRVIEPEAWGAALLYFTGSKDHNIEIRKLAQGKGFKLNEYGLADGEKSVARETEEAVYEALGLSWIAPELREDRGEIQAAQEDKLPALVEQADLQGDLQMHTTWSDGNADIQAMAEKADALGYAYILITDHGPGLRVAGGPSEDQLAEVREEIEQVNEQVDVEVLMGLEANIDKEGQLDVSAEACQDVLDLVVISLHDKVEDATERILAAMEAYPVDILAHPTNRLIGSREPNALDLEAIIEAAEAHHVAIEINSQPTRLDLDWQQVQDHRGTVPFVISTDAHTPGQLDTIHLGVSMARKGWLTADQVLNTQELDEVMAYLRP